MNGRILVVDDEEIILTSCERILAPEGYQVDMAVSGKDALSLLEKGSYDLIITDIKMPEMDGIEFMGLVREKKPDIAIIVITGYPSQESIREALSLRIVDYLPKPFSPTLLIEVVQKAMEVQTKGVLPEPSVEDYSDATTEQLDAIIRKYRDKRGSLIPVLQEAQELVGYLPPTVQRYIAKGLKIPVSEVYGVVSFYSFFSMKPRGRHKIKVCLGTACYANGAEEIVKRIEDGLQIEGKGITQDKRFSIETVRCLGACGLAPVVVVDKDTHGSVAPMKALEILKSYE
ncbi:MAG: response regulator [Nitrospirales bacterium]|nr:response regulator [Nitrospirales bacterium]